MKRVSSEAKQVSFLDFLQGTGGSVVCLRGSDTGLQHFSAESRLCYLNVIRSWLHNEARIE